MQKKKSSLDWLVASRGYAMFGVFLGHLMISYRIDADMTSLITVGRFLEPTFVPFFVMLTGAFYQRGKNRFRSYAWLKFSQRMIPFYFYLLLVLPFHFILMPEADTLKWLPMYVVAVPYLSWPTWFLAALFISEIIYFFLQPFGKSKPEIILLALTCYTLGWLYNHYIFELPPMASLIGLVSMLHASLVFCGFFFVGMLSKPFIMRFSRWPTYKVALLGCTCLALMTPGVLLNSFTVPPEGHYRALFSQEMVIISAGQYGNYFWFLSSTLFGAGTLLCISRLIPVTAIMRTCGDQSLLLLGLNAIFHGVLNSYIVEYFPPPANTLLWTLPYTLVLAMVSMLICLPVAIILSHYLPQLTGRPMLSGPWLPAIYRKPAPSPKR
ncbi:Uncharacterised protein [BD1-7 clade bacterium]|uniref:Acyltransferase 3 domain-containing protein n=1 Tax=BD1-7 clade bacterium TaxID=2029982 RepID=A0A5S9MZ24_9GAMM|nr:Uncharacterised protein [BD1-7 clade bacterium]